MFDKTKYGRILVPILTPYAADQSVDHAALKSLATYLIDNKMADSLVLSGTTGEFHTQLFAERVAIFETVKAAVGGGFRWSPASAAPRPWRRSPWRRRPWRWASKPP